MTIHLTGAVLANIIFEHSNSVCDQEGLLFGKLSNIVTDTISDSSLNNIEHRTVYHLQSFLQCDKLFSWYNTRGEVKEEILKKLLANCNPKDVIGWYKLRRNCSMSLSLRERSVHHHLEEWMKRHFHQNRRLIFFLCVSQSNCNGALYTTDHQFMIQDGRRFQNMPVMIMNLGNIAKPDYHSVPNFTCSIDSTYNDVINKLRSSFVNGLNELASVKTVESLKFNLHEKLKSLCEQLTESEAELAKEMTELKQLKAQLKSAEGFASSSSVASDWCQEEICDKKSLFQLHSTADAQSSTADAQSSTVPTKVDSKRKEREEEEKLLIDFDDDDDKVVHGNSIQSTARNQAIKNPAVPFSDRPHPLHLLDDNSDMFDAVQLKEENVSCQNFSAKDKKLSDFLTVTSRAKVETIQKSKRNVQKVYDRDDR